MDNSSRSGTHNAFGHTSIGGRFSQFDFASSSLFVHFHRDLRDIVFGHGDDQRALLVFVSFHETVKVRAQVSITDEAAMFSRQYATLDALKYAATGHVFAWQLLNVLIEKRLGTAFRLRFDAANH